MPNSKTVLVAGDLVVDQYLIKAPQLPTTYGESRDKTVSIEVRGGAWYLAELVRKACEAISGISVTGPNPDADSTIGRAYTVWAQYPRCNTKPKEKVWRISEFLGCDSESTKPRQSDKLPVTADSTPPDLLVLDDLELGFGADENRWPAAIRDGNWRGQIVLKLGAPPKASLWKRLLEAHADHLTVIVSVKALRARGAGVSCGLSWDRTIEELAREFENGLSAYDLARCRRTIVYFSDGSAAASFTRCPLKLGPVSRADLQPSATFERFLYLPDEAEGTWAEGMQGRMFGMGSLVTAAVVRHVLDEVNYPLYLTLGRALAAGRYAFETGSIFVPASLMLKQTDTDEKVKFRSDEKGCFDRLLFVPPPDDPKSDKPKPEDPASAYYTAYPHDILDDDRMRQPATKSDLLRDVAGPTVEYMKAKAFQIVQEGPKKALKAVPKAHYEKYTTVDREEIERINAVRALINEYRANPADRRPLSIAVFGQPGSGKSFAIKQLGKSLFGDKQPTLEFNLSQFAGDQLHQLHQAFHRVRDACIQGEIPLVFWDEFDTDGLKWLKHFLAPMQDAEFRSGSDLHVFGRAVFVFAGGTKHSFAEFDRSEARDDDEGREFREQKGPDFISRLRGHIDIKGPNAAGGDATNDPAYVIRRAMILRAALERMYGHLIVPDTGVALVDAPIIQAFLNAQRFLHGARSIESLLAMCRLEGAQRFGLAQLNAQNMLSMHVSKNFFTDLNRYAFDTELMDLLAAAIHEGWQEAKRQQLATSGGSSIRTISADLAMKSYRELEPSDQERNLAVARVMPAKLGEVGYQLVCQPPRASVTQTVIPKDKCGRLARLEHDRWLREKLIEGYEHGPDRSSTLRQHPDIAPFDRLGSDEQHLDFVLSEILPGILAERRIALKPEDA